VYERAVREYVGRAPGGAADSVQALRRVDDVPAGGRV